MQYKKSNWLQVSANKLLGDQSGGIKMSDWFFGQNLQKRSKTEKYNITLEFYVFEIVSVPNFILNWQMFWTKLTQKGNFQPKTEKVNTSADFYKFKLL